MTLVTLSEPPCINLLCVCVLVISLSLSLSITLSPSGVCEFITDIYTQIYTHSYIQKPSLFVCLTTATTVTTMETNKRYKEIPTTNMISMMEDEEEENGFSSHQQPMGGIVVPSSSSSSSALGQASFLYPPPSDSESDDDDEEEQDQEHQEHHAVNQDPYQPPAIPSLFGNGYSLQRVNGQEPEAFHDESDDDDDVHSVDPGVIYQFTKSLEYGPHSWSHGPTRKRKRRFSVCFYAIFLVSLMAITTMVLSWSGAFPKASFHKSSSLRHNSTTSSSSSSMDEAEGDDAIHVGNAHTEGHVEEPVYHDGPKLPTTDPPQPTLLPTPQNRDDTAATTSSSSSSSNTDSSDSSDTQDNTDDDDSSDDESTSTGTDDTQNSTLVVEHPQHEASTSSYQYHVWKQLGTDMVGTTGGDYVGESVVLSDDGWVVAVGAPGANNGRGRVQVYLYHVPTNSWNPLGSTLEGIGQFGVSLDLSSNGFTLAAGGNLATDSDQNIHGHVHVYEYDHENKEDWVNKGDPIEGDGAFDNVGWSVALSGDGKKLAVGSPNYENHQGRVQLFYWHHHRWTKLGPQVVPDRPRGVGYAVSMSRDAAKLAIVSNGAPSNSPHSISVWRRHNHTHWLPMGDPITNIGDELDHLGQRIQLSGDGSTLAVSARFSASNATSFTQIYRYMNGQWSPWGGQMDARLDTDGDGPTQEHTAVSLSADGSVVAVGSPHDEAALEGRVRVFAVPDWKDENTEVQWHLIGDQLLGPEGFGGAVAISGHGLTVAVGAGHYDQQKGLARIYERSEGEGED